MFNRIKIAVAGAVEGFEIGRSSVAAPLQVQQPLSRAGGLNTSSRHNLPHKHRYSRPGFLKLNEEKVSIAGDRKIRPIINTSEELLNNAGYAECVNAGKSQYNEDQAVMAEGMIRGSRPFEYEIPYHFFAVFDGHAGFGAALDSSKQLHHIVNQKFLDMADDIFSSYLMPENCFPVTSDTLIIGALESAFLDMDNVIAENRQNYYPAGGCTVLVAIFIFDKLYVANAGDSRAVLCTNGIAHPMSNDFTPTSDKLRIRMKAFEQPSLLGNSFSCREYRKQPTGEDMGKTVLYREPNMTGWTYRTIDETDLRTPIVAGKGKRSRVMSTIGVTRGFGDHDLVSYVKRVPIKPFLSNSPEVTVYTMKNAIDNQAVLLATDGLWDVVIPETAAKICTNSFDNYEAKNRWTAAATSLVSCARGSFITQPTAASGGGTGWRMKDDRPASADDITVLIIPLAHYYAVHLAHSERYTRALRVHQRQLRTELNREREEQIVDRILREANDRGEEVDPAEMALIIGQAKAHAQQERERLRLLTVRRKANHCAVNVANADVVIVTTDRYGNLVRTSMAPRAPQHDDSINRRRRRRRARRERKEHGERQEYDDPGAPSGCIVVVGGEPYDLIDAVNLTKSEENGETAKVPVMTSKLSAPAVITTTTTVAIDPTSSSLPGTSGRRSLLPHVSSEDTSDNELEIRLRAAGKTKESLRVRPKKNKKEPRSEDRTDELHRRRNGDIGGPSSGGCGTSSGSTSLPSTNRRTSGDGDGAPTSGSSDKQNNARGKQQATTVEQSEPFVDPTRFSDECVDIPMSDDEDEDSLLDEREDDDDRARFGVLRLETSTPNNEQH